MKNEPELCEKAVAVTQIFRLWYHGAGLLIKQGCTKPMSGMKYAMGKVFIFFFHYNYSR
jgi:hypothetical protein